MEVNKREEGQSSTSLYIQTKTPTTDGSFKENPSVLKNTSDTNLLEKLKTFISTIIEFNEISLPLIGKILIPRLKENNIQEKPQTSNKSEYGKIKVNETKSGHVFIQDDTPGNERIVTIHCKGTYETIDNEGTITKKSIKDTIFITTNDFKLAIGNDFISVIEGNEEIQIKKNKSENISGNNNVYIGKNKNEYINGDYSNNSNGSISFITTKNFAIQATSSITIQGSGNIIIRGNGAVTINSSSIVSVSAPLIKLG